MDESPEISNVSGNADIGTLDYLHGVESSTCLLLSKTPSPTPLNLQHPLSVEMSDGPFLTLNDVDDPTLSNIQAGMCYFVVYWQLYSNQN